MGIIDDFTARTSRFIETLVTEIVMFLFGVEPLRTAGPWPLGRPNSPTNFNSEAAFDGGAVAYIADEVYPWVAVTEAGGLLIFSMILFAVAYSTGGFFQFFDWQKEDPKNQKPDPLYGLGMMMFWFPLYYGLVSIVHEIFLLIPVDIEAITLFITGVASSFFVVPYANIFIIIGTIGLILIGVLNYIRAIMIGGFLLFGPVMIAVGWARIPVVSEVAINYLKYSIGLALAPLPLPIILFLLTVTLRVFDLSIIISIGLGSVIFAALTVLVLYLEWKIFKSSSQIVSKAGDLSSRGGAAIGIYQRTGSAQKAAKAARYGAGSYATRESVRAWQKGGTNGDSGGSDGSSGGD